MQSVISQLGPDICKNILFLHAVLGCDTTSRLHGIGKGNSIKKFRVSKYFSEQVISFGSPSATISGIIAAGENILVTFYNGKVGETLNSLRYKKFCEKVASSSTHVEPQTLPPTSAAAKYHSMRVYCQVQQWKGKHASPDELGWKRSGDRLVPIGTDLAPAPDELLRIIRCNCQSDCSTLRCTCRKHGISCSVVCGNCKGCSCTNCETVSDDIDED